MSNPSTVWTQLSLPNPSQGSLPYVDTDGVSVVTDVVNYFYSQGLAQLSGSICPYQLTVYGGVRVGYTDATATPGAATINKTVGRVKIAAGQSTLVVTSSYCFATSIVQLQLETADATLTRAIVTPTAGGFIITGNAVATAAVTVNFLITNVY